jgi:hypothetical protein
MQLRLEKKNIKKTVPSTVRDLKFELKNESKKPRMKTTTWFVSLILNGMETETNYFLRHPNY